MGRLFVIRYDQTQDSRIFLCTTCHTQLALRQEVVSMVRKNESLLLEKAVNVVIDTHEHYHLEDAFDHIVLIEADVYCVGCNLLLGQKIIEVDSFHERLMEGRQMLELRKLVYWNGKQMIDAITLLPRQPEEGD